MSGITIHFVPGAAVTPFSTLWLCLSVGGAIVFFLLLIFLLKSIKKRKADLKPEKQPVSQNADIQHILKVLQKSNGQVRPVLLAGSGHADLPVIIPVLPIRRAAGDAVTLTLPELVPSDSPTSCQGSPLQSMVPLVPLKDTAVNSSRYVSVAAQLWDAPAQTTRKSTIPLKARCPVSIIESVVLISLSPET